MAHTQTFRRIGQGFCGTVWADAAEATDSTAIKREDGGPGRSLYNDYKMHQVVFRNLCINSSTALVPDCHRYVYGDNQSWWDDHLFRFPKECQVPCNVLLTSRIPPFSKRVRENLIDLYCPESLRSSIKSSEPDQDCLIRPYLGRRRRLEAQSRFKAFSLRNYPLHIDQIKHLALDATLYARVMAETLAILYWKARIDANDVEFVLAPPPTNQSSASGSVIESETLGRHVVWILDFDCCKPLPLDEKGVEQAVVAFYRNDPYYPRPTSSNEEDIALWVAFKERFLEASESFLEPGSMEARLPKLWIEMVEDRVKI